MKGAIFDVDGTLLDSMNAWFNVTMDFFKENNIVFTEKQLEGFKSMTLEESLPMIKRDYNLSLSVEEIFESFKVKVAYEYANNIPLKKGAKEYLKKLHDEGVKIALATSGYEGLCKSAFSRLGIWEYVDACAFSSEVGVNKSNPDVYLLAAERIGIAPSDCTVFEDIPLGIEGAKKGGFSTCAISDPSNKGEWDALKEMADMHILDYTELL